MSGRYTNRWGKIKQFQIPKCVITDNTLTGSPVALSALLVLLQIYKNKATKDNSPIGTVTIGQKKLIERTGYAKNAISTAIRILVQKHYVTVLEHTKKHGEFGTNEYVLLNPKTEVPLNAGGNLAYTNGLPYFTFPSCVVTEHEAKWSLAKMTSSDLRLYCCLLYLANRHRSNEFHSTAAELRKLSGLSPASLAKTVDSLESLGLVWMTKGGAGYSCNLCDPYTGDLLHDQTGVDEDDPANYYVEGEKGRAKRVNVNGLTAEQIEGLLRGSVSRPESIVHQANGDLMIQCPFHSDSNPSCSVSPKKNGCFYCFGCGEKGGFIKLMTGLKGGGKAEIIQDVATATGTKLEYHAPDANAVKYSYRDAKGKLIKQVLRYPDKDGVKVFAQRRPAAGGDWAWNTTGLPPALFNADQLIFADTVCITEGEKDSTTMNELHLSSSRGADVLGVTSGGAESWDASLARQLRGYKVVLMPDGDAAGAKFEASVEASLKAEGIEYRVVKFDDVGRKDVTDFLDAGHSVDELAQRIGPDLVHAPDSPYRNANASSPETVECDVTF